MKAIILTAIIIALLASSILFLVFYITRKLSKYRYITPFKRRCKKCDQEQWLNDDERWIDMYKINDINCNCHNDTIN